MSSTYYIECRVAGYRFASDCRLLLQLSDLSADPMHQLRGSPRTPLDQQCRLKEIQAAQSAFGAQAAKRSQRLAESGDDAVFEFRREANQRQIGHFGRFGRQQVAIWPGIRIRVTPLPA